MRTRTRTAPYSPSGTMYSYLGDPGNITAMQPIPEGVREYSLMTDSNNGRARPDSFCEHWSINGYHYPVTNTSSVTFSPYGQGYENAAPLVNPVSIPGLAILPDFDTYRQTASDLLRERYATLVKSFSLANNLLEIGDAGELFKKMSRLIIKQKEFEFRYLDYKFGIAPLYGDLVTLRNNCLGIQDAIRKMRSLNGIKQRFSHRLGTASVVFPEGYPQYHGITTHGSLVGPARTNGILTVGLPPINDLLSNIQVILDVIGGHLDILTLYDATPFTWLLDWIIPIGDYLERLVDRRYIKPELTLIRGSVSIAVSGKLTFYQGSVEGYPNFQRKLCAEFSTKYYRREALSLPTFLENLADIPHPRFPRITPSQAMILLGLTGKV